VNVLSQRGAKAADKPHMATSELAVRYNRGYTENMKTAISIPDAIFEEAERLAELRGLSRSELYANAVSAYVNRERFMGIREKLDAVYGQNADDSAVDPALANAQARSLPKEKW
jgi:predicted transcriptional regulator